MTAALLAAALLLPDSPELPAEPAITAPSGHELDGYFLLGGQFHYAICTCGWVGLGMHTKPEAEADFHLHKRIHGYVHDERAGWVHV